MAYRGEDLDLRTPQGWGTAGRDQQTTGEQPNWWTRSTIYHGGRADPIWIDDTVMACCNHAYDLAVAHRASEVGLEHLLNALTLNSAAAQVLEARGIREAALRRETSAAVAAVIPSGQANGTAVPKRSEALEDALRMAADRAYPRRTPVTVDDLLGALFDMKRDYPGLQLLYRNASQWGRSNGVDPRGGARLEPLPHLARGYAGDPRREQRDQSGAGRPRHASPAAHDYFTASGPSATHDRPFRDRDRERDVGGYPGPGASTIDSLQNNRIDALERAVRDLALDLTDDRKSLQAIVGELQRNSSAQADDTQRFRGGLSDRLATLEDVLSHLRDDPRQTQLPPVIMDRLSALERNLDSRLGDMAHSLQASSSTIDRLATIERNLEIRLSELGRAWSGVGERLAAIEAAASRPQIPAPLPTMLIDHIDRMPSIEHKLDAVSGQIDRLDNVSGLELKVAALESTFQLILDRMVGLERHLDGNGEAHTIDLKPLELKLVDMERNVVAQLGGDPSWSQISGQLQALPAVQTRLEGIERAVENRTAETGRTVSFIGERLRAFDEAISSHRTQTTDRLSQIEKMMSSYADRVTEAGTSHTSDLIELHEAIVKLNTNQQTLANALDQWRLDGTGDLSVLSNRLKSLEETDNRREPVFQALAGQLATLHKAMARREEHKSRFRNWLFGTDEWYSASYDTAHWKERQKAAAILPGAAGSGGSIGTQNGGMSVSIPAPNAGGGSGGGSDAPTLARSPLPRPGQITPVAQIRR